MQRRHDARSRTAAPRLVMPAVRRVQALGVASLLDLPEQEWRQKVGAQADESALFLLDARDALETLRDGSGREIEYPRDVRRLNKLPGITTPAGRPCPRARLRFDRIPQPWLRELGKRSNASGPGTASPRRGPFPTVNGLPPPLCCGDWKPSPHATGSWRRRTNNSGKPWPSRSANGALPTSAASVRLRRHHRQERSARAECAQPLGEIHI